MILTTSQITFLTLFNVLFLILFNFGDSYLGIYTMGALTLLFLFFKGRIDFKKLKIHSFIISLWVVFLIGILISTFFSHSIALSINSLFFYGFSFLVFMFFLLVKKDFLSKEMVVGSFLMQIVILIIFSFILLFVPRWGMELPGMNLIYSTYGHNHLASLLLLVLPVSWWWGWNVFKKSNNTWSLLLPIVFTLSLLTSFGRIAVMIGFVQFLFLVYILLKNYGGLVIKKRILRNLILVILVLFSTFTITKLFFSISGMRDSNFVCPIISLEKKICKSFNSEMRPSYWIQSINVIKDYPIIGYGPGTFSLINKKYREEIYSNTSYAHNAFLQVFSESGLIVGGTFLVLMLFPLFKVRKRSFKNNLSLNFSLFLGLFSIYLNILFDFDWSFISVFSLSLVFIAFLIKDEKKLHKINILKINLFFKERFLKFFYFFVNISILVFVFIYLLTDFLIMNGKINEAFDVFPYFGSHSIVFLKSDELTLENRQNLLDIHYQNPNFYERYLFLNTSSDYLSDDFIEKSEHYCSIDALSCELWVNSKVKDVQKKADEFIENGDLYSAEKTLIFLKKFRKTGYWEIHQLGNFYLMQGRDEEALNEFDECLDISKKFHEGKVHDDCEGSKDSLQKNYPNRNRYWEVSQIILGKASWENFTEYNEDL